MAGFGFAIRESDGYMIGPSVARATGQLNIRLLPIHSIVAVLIFMFVPPSLAQSGNGYRWDHEVAKISEEPVSVANVKVAIDASKMRNIVGYRAFGIHTTVHDANLVNPQVVALLSAAAINTLRYPGGAYADTYHWSNYKPTAWQGKKTPKDGDYSENNNFGFFVRLLDYIQNGTALITVNYGSNLTGTGGGEPAEAAAWVAYCNGDPSDSKDIGKDSSGTDWKTVC